MRRFSLFILPIAMILAAGGSRPAVAQESEPPSLESAANRAAAEDWAGAARIFQALTEAQPDNGAAWFGLGGALYNTRQVDPSLAAFEKALELGFQPHQTMIQLARGHAAKGDDAETLAWLGKAAESGASVYQPATTMEEFRRLFGNAEFQALLEKTRPCNTPAHHLLDFWIGSWRVVVGEQEQQIGTNSIFKVLNGCAVIENWKGAAGNEGKSLFYFHNNEKTWKQVWVTDSEGFTEKHLIAALGGALRFQGEIRAANGRIILDRTTLIPLEKDNRVRQVIEQSPDGGETWQVTFDAIYIRE